MKKDRKSSFEKIDRIAIATGLVIIILWIGLPFLLYFIFDQSQIASEERGQFGDMYGVLTSLFSGITIIGLIYTIILQRQDIGIATAALKKQHHELELNRRELRLNRVELKETRKEFKLQNRTFRYQRFESTFFHLIELSLKVALQYLDKEAMTTHHISGEKVKTSVLGHFEMVIIKDVFEHSTDYHQMKTRYIEKFASYINNVFIQYLNNFEVVINFISTKRTKKAREKYFKIFVAQLTASEKKFLYYHFALDEKPECFEELCPILFKGLLTRHFFEIQKTVIIESQVHFLPDQVHLDDVLPN